MKKQFSAALAILSVVVVSIFIMILPTFQRSAVSEKEVHRNVNLPIFSHLSSKKVALVFFGYSGCIDICTPRLQALSDFYNGLPKELQKSLTVEFIDISTPDDRTLPARFAQAFNKEFHGHYLSEQEVREYTKPFAVFFSKPLSRYGEFSHSSNLYLLKKTDKGNAIIRYVYSAYPYDFKNLKSAIERLLNE